MKASDRTKRPFGPGKPPLTVPQILAWADPHHARTGRWPSCTEGQVRGAPGETWRNVNQALSLGLRGLPGGDTLPRLLGKRPVSGVLRCRVRSGLSHPRGSFTNAPQLPP